MTNLSNQLPSDDNFSIRADWPQRRGALTEHRDAFADRCTGNGLEEFKICQEFGLTTMELLDLLLDVNVERCPHCRWLVDSHELCSPNSGDVDGYCNNCRSRE